MDIKVLNELNNDDLQKAADKFRQHYTAMLAIREEFAVLGLALHVENPAGGPPVKSSSFTASPDKYTFRGEVKIVKSF